MIAPDGTYYAHGKLLLTGEYFVLDGALAIGLPTKPGQWLHWKQASSQQGQCHWRSYDADGSVWFEGYYDLQTFRFLQGSAEDIGKTLEHILQSLRVLNPEFLYNAEGIEVETRLEFPRLWGLGSSSTLLSNLASWAQVNPFELLAKTFGGSGYDLAAASASGPFWFQENEPVAVCPFEPPFADKLYFVYLGQKQNSRAGISQYRSAGTPAEENIEAISDISRGLPECTDLTAFMASLLEHEQLVAKTIGMERIQTQRFPDFPGLVKSLGAWGGDFVLACSDRNASEVQAYFNEKGCKVFFRYLDLIK